MPDWKLCEMCAEEFFVPKICTLNCVARTSSILGTLHVSGALRATHFARRAFQVRAEDRTRAQQSFQTGRYVHLFHLCYFTGTLSKHQMILLVKGSL